MPAFEAGRSLRLGEHVMLGGTPAAHHIADVLRARHGERIVLFHAGELYDAVVEDASRTGLAVSVEGVRQSPFCRRSSDLHSSIMLSMFVLRWECIVLSCMPLNAASHGMSPGGLSA